LDRAQGLAISPDGRSLYVVATNAGSTYGAGPVYAGAINHFALTADGALSYRGCIGGSGSGCSSIDPAMHWPTDAVVSPDGRSLYVTQAEAPEVGSTGRVIAYALDAAGEPTFRACINDTGQSGCTVAAKPSLFDPRDLAVSPDGDSLYVSSFDRDGSVTHLALGPDGGMIYRDCLANDGAYGCARARQPTIEIPSEHGLAISPDGRALYVNNPGGVSLDPPEGGAAITRIALGPAGAMSYDGCAAALKAYGCGERTPNIGFWFSVAVHPRSSSVYVFANAVLHLFADDGGRPATRKRGGPARRIDSRRATFRFTSSEPGSSFQCSLDGRRFKRCASPERVRRLKAGKHAFRARAVDPTGARDRTPVHWSFRVVRG
jgi:DNA-binding beta-propeller fold protein YncE